MSGRDTSGADRTLARGGRWTASVTVLLIGAGVAPFIVLGRGDQLWDAWVVHNVLFGLLLAVVLWLTAPSSRAIRSYGSSLWPRRCPGSMCSRRARCSGCSRRTA